MVSITHPEMPLANKEDGILGPAGILEAESEDIILGSAYKCNNGCNRLQRVAQYKWPHQ
jgi:hypothetical protein